MPLPLGATNLVTCPFGTLAFPLLVLPASRVAMQSLVPATVPDDQLPNVATFGLCSSPANPVVAAVILASLGTVTQAPCVPLVVTPWMPPRPDILVGGIPASVQDGRCQCAWGGSISPTPVPSTVLYG